MSDDWSALTFDPIEFSDWEAQALSGLKGKDLSDLTASTVDGISVKPLYARAKNTLDSAGRFPFTRSTQREQTHSGLELRQHYSHPDPAVCNQLILEDLQHGANGIHLDFTSAKFHNSAKPLPATLRGIVVEGPDDLEKLLKDIHLDIVPISLSAGSKFKESAHQMENAWNNRELTKDQCKGSFNADPLAVFALSGNPEALTDSMFVDVGQLAARTSEHYKGVRSVAINAGLYHDAGASIAQELGLMLASARQYLQSLLDAGLSIDAACQQIEVNLAVDTNYFHSAAKLRAARLLWARLCAECGATEAACRLNMVARTSQRMLTRHDPWTNILRTTIATSAAVLGGAPVVTVHGYDAVTGIMTTRGRRIARNTSNIIQEESHLHRVIDPLGGSGYIESFTESLCEKAWQQFQEIEKNKGIINSLLDSSVHKAINKSHQAEMELVRHRKKTVVGINEFANIDEAQLSIDETLLEQATKALNRAEFNENLVAEDTSTLEPKRLSEEFESLRDTVNRYTHNTGKTPCIHTFAFGTPAEYIPKVQFCHNLLNAGGIQTSERQSDFEGLSSSVQQRCVDAYQKSDAVTVLLVLDQQQQHEAILDLVRSLSKAKKSTLFYAGRPADNKQKIELEEAGITAFIYKNCDAKVLTEQVHKALGVSQ